MEDPVNSGACYSVYVILERIECSDTRQVMQQDAGGEHEECKEHEEKGV